MLSNHSSQAGTSVREGQVGHPHFSIPQMDGTVKNSSKVDITTLL